MAPVFLLKNWLYKINIVFIIKLYFICQPQKIQHLLEDIIGCF